MKEVKKINRKLIPTIMVMLFLVSSGVALAYASESSGWVTGAGTIGSGYELDSFGGWAAMFKDGSGRGRWQHIDHLGQNIFQGKVNFLNCYNNPESGPEAVADKAVFGGEGKYNGVPGHLFVVSVLVFDQYYSITIYYGDDGIVFFASGILSSGNIQIHPPNEGHPATPPL